MNNHSIIPPSAAAIWGAPGGCTGWVLMSQQYPEVEGGEEALEGEASHEIAASLITSAMNGPTLPGPENYVGKQAANGIIFTEEMYNGAFEYATDVSNVMREHSIFGGRGLGIEQRLEIPNIHELSFGTPDTFLYDFTNRNLYIWDFKFGYIIYEAFENWQMINYIAGIIKRFKIDGIDDQSITIHLRIVQPRAFHKDGSIREWKTTLSNLRGYFNILHANANEALGPDSVIRSGPHCAYCSARHVCPAALQAGLTLYEVATKPTPIELSPQALGVQLLIIKRALKQLEYLESGFEEQCKALIKRGEIIPNWMLEMGRGRVKWNKPASEILALGSVLGHDLGKPIDVITPNQAKKLGIDDAVISAYSEKSRTGLKLVPDNGNKAKQLFT